MSPHGEPLRYPPTTRVDQRDDYHGTTVDDPYRWLEDLDSEQTAAFVRAQNEVSFGYLSGIPERDAIKRRLTELWNYERYGLPFLRGRHTFWLHNDGLQNQAVLFHAPAPDADAEVLLDPNTWSTDGTMAIGELAVSDDGRLLAYGVSAAGSDWQEWRVVSVETKQALPDVVSHVKFSSVSFTKDGSGFFYSRYPDRAELENQNVNHTLHFHRIGTEQADDVVVYARPDHPDWLILAEVSEDGRWLVIEVMTGSSANNGILALDLEAEDAEVREVLMDFDASYAVFDIQDSTLFVRTDLGAPRGRVLAIDLTDPSAQRELIPEAPDALLGVSAVGGAWFAHYLNDATSQVKQFRPDGTFVRDVELPGLGSAGGFGGRREHTDTFYSFDTFTQPLTIFRYDIQSGVSTVFRSPDVPFDPDEFETTRAFYTSKDGRHVPLFVFHRKGLHLDGSNPAYLTGYGGFRIPMMPMFAPAPIAWLQMGGVYAVACLRGGSEYGEQWHEAGTKERKQNVFDDFIAAAEWLTDQGYTQPSRLAVGGGSNGGLLIGACITQRPELFGAARIAVGVLDMLRFHRFTIGAAWVSDYGCADEPDDFKYLYAYSPLHNVRVGVQYPATLITTGDHDDRVVPSHSFKFAATLQPAQAGAAPVLLRVDVRAGHGLGKPTAKLIDESADVWAFFAHRFGMSPPS